MDKLIKSEIKPDRKWQGQARSPVVPRLVFFFVAQGDKVSLHHPQFPFKRDVVWSLHNFWLHCFTVQCLLFQCKWNNLFPIKPISFALIWFSHVGGPLLVFRTRTQGWEVQGTVHPNWDVTTFTPHRNLQVTHACCTLDTVGWFWLCVQGLNASLLTFQMKNTACILPVVKQASLTPRVNLGMCYMMPMWNRPPLCLCFSQGGKARHRSFSVHTSCQAWSPQLERRKVKPLSRRTASAAQISLLCCSAEALLLPLCCRQKIKNKQKKTKKPLCLWNCGSCLANSHESSSSSTY